MGAAKERYDSLKGIENREGRWKYLTLKPRAYHLRILNNY